MRPKTERFKTRDILKSRHHETDKRWVVATGMPGLRTGYYLLFLIEDGKPEFLSVESWSDLNRRFMLAEPVNV